MGYVQVDLPFDYFVCGFESIVSDPVFTTAGSETVSAYNNTEFLVQTVISDTGIYSIAATGTTKRVKISDSIKFKEVDSAGLCSL